MSKLIIAHYKSPINEYDYLAIDNGARPPPQVFLLDSRPCYVAGQTRVRHMNRAHGFYNSITVRYLDGTAESMGAAQFAKRARTAPLTLALEPTP